MSKYSKIIILVDSFKSSISSKEIALIGKKVINEHIPNLKVDASCVADGGEGTVDFFINEMGYEKVYTKTVNAHLEPIETYYAVKGNNAVYDVASVVGFLVNKSLDIYKTTSYGIGLVLKEIISKGYKNIYLGLGGSITNDGGSGILEALGGKFYYNDQLIEVHKNGHIQVNRVDYSLACELLKEVKISAICDVVNPLLGNLGATYVFSPQKGSKEEDLPILEAWMQSYSALFDVDSNYPGCGAAGGIGFIIKVLGGLLEKGIDVILKELDISNKLNPNVLLITGEGKLDQTSMYGKVVGKLCDLTEFYHNDLVIICGSNALSNIKYEVYPLHDIVPINYKETVKNDIEKVFLKIVDSIKNNKFKEKKSS